MLVMWKSTHGGVKRYYTTKPTDEQVAHEMDRRGRNFAELMRWNFRAMEWEVIQHYRST